MRRSFSDQHIWALRAYLEEYATDTSKPWVVAVSGGVDSMVLLDAFIKLSCDSSVNLPSEIIVAHVNHGWREEAYKDLELIKRVLQEVNFPQGSTSKTVFTLQEESLGLSNQVLPGENAEAMARLARYSFFERLAKESGAKVVFLAHHLQDKQETLIKNLFEGKELVYLDGLRKQTYRNTIELARPFLCLGKKDLENIAKQQAIGYEVDVTNSDTRYLRARMRQKLEPLLDEIWPTSWRKGLQQFCCYLEEWKEMLDTSIDPQSLAPTHGILGLKWTLPDKTRAMKMPAVRYWLRRLSASIDPLEREGSSRLSKALLERLHGHYYRSRRFLWSVNGDDLFSLDPSYQEEYLSFFGKKIDEVHVGPWRMGLLYDSQAKALSNWSAFWKGYWTSPEFESGSWLDFQTLPPALRRRVLARYQKRHIPSFLRQLAPIWIQTTQENAQIWTLADPWPNDLDKDQAVKTWTWER